MTDRPPASLDDLGSPLHDHAVDEAPMSYNGVPGGVVIGSADGLQSLLAPDDAPGAHRGGRAAVLTPILVSAFALVAAVAGTLTDLRVPTAADWHIVTVLGVIGVLGLVAGYRFNPPDDDAAPPWDVHTIWLLPAALLTPPAAFGPLVALSLVAGLTKRAHPLRWRVVVASITVLTTMALHGATQLLPGFAVSGLVGIAALWIIGALTAITVAHAIGTPRGTVLWLDDRWTFVELGCAFCGLLLAAAMRSDPNLGLAGLAPLLLAAFALRWPELSRHARIDPKTGLPNAWHWEERTRELLSAAELRNTPATVMIIDLDRFKLVNDTYGHLAGDQVLVDLAAAMQSELRQGDLIGRFGGEEFVVTAFGLDRSSSILLAERIRARIAGQRHRVDGARQQTRGGTAECTVTCTIGVACSDDHGYDVIRLLDLADTALAAGKVEGRNRVSEARTVLETAGAADSRPRRTSGRPGSMLALARRRRSDRRTLRHGPGSLFR